VHIATLCITISLCATVALACLFSPKVYIILLHPEKNMRLTKQLKAQANSIRFASQLPTNTEFPVNHHVTNKDIVNNDKPTNTGNSNSTEETKELLISNRTITCQTSPNNNFDNSNIMINDHKRKLPTIIMTSRSDGCLTDDKQRLSIKRYNYDDQDSLNSNSIQDEQIML
jgi:hypothetical protein